MKCVKCGKEMESPSGISIIGIHIRLALGDDATQEDMDFIREQFGKYDIKKPYDFCYECWLDSLFGNQQYDIAKLASEIARLHKVESDIMKGKIPR